MKTVTVQNRELLVRDGDDLIVMSVAGQRREVPDAAVVTETGSPAIRPSSSWIGHMAIPDAQPALSGEGE